MRNLIAITILSALLLTACDNDDASSSVSTTAGTPRAAEAHSICDVERAVQDGVSGISMQDGRVICLTMGASLGREPSSKLLATMEKVVFIMRATFALEDSARDITNQVMSIIKSRHQIDSADEVMLDTMNVIVKCANGSHGAVTPRRLAENMRQAGDASASLSDDGIYSLSATIQLMDEGGNSP